MATPRPTLIHFHKIFTHFCECSLNHQNIINTWWPPKRRQSAINEPSWISRHWWKKSEKHDKMLESFYLNLQQTVSIGNIIRKDVSSQAFSQALPLIKQNSVYQAPRRIYIYSESIKLFTKWPVYITWNGFLLQHHKKGFMNMHLRRLFRTQLARGRRSTSV